MWRMVLPAVVASSLVSVLLTLAGVGVVSPRLAEAQDSPAVVAAERFVLQDPEGNIRAELRFDPFGEPVLVMRDREGAPRSRIGIRRDGGAFLNFHDPDFSRRVALGVAEGEARLLLREPGTGIEAGDARFRAGLSVSADGTLSLELRDALGNAIWTAP